MARKQKLRNLSMLDKGLAGLWEGYKAGKEKAGAAAKWEAYQQLQRDLSANRNKVDGQELIDYALSMGLPYEQITQWIKPGKNYDYRLGKSWIDELKIKIANKSKEEIAKIRAKARVQGAKISANRPRGAGKPETASGPDIRRKVMENLISNMGYDPKTSLMTLAASNKGQLDDLLKAYPEAMKAAIEAEGLTGRIRPTAPFKITDPGGWFSSPEIKALSGYEVVPQANGTMSVAKKKTPTPVTSPSPRPTPMAVPAPGVGAVPATDAVDTARESLKKKFRRF